MKKAHNALDITGQRYGRLVGIRLLDKRGKATIWEMQCDCGAVTKVALGSVRFGLTKSCGCLKTESTLARLTKHGHSPAKGSSTTYICYNLMKRRCCDKNNQDWRHYGGRGIKVCDRWLESFANFLADMGEKPKGLTLDRKDNNGNYEPGNCRWISRKEQSRNTRRNHIVEFNGHKGTLAEWEEITGFNQQVISARLRNGWPIDKALTTPIRQNAA